MGVLVWTLVLSVLKGSLGEILALKAAVWVMWGFIIIGMAMVANLPEIRPSKANILDRSQVQ